MGISVHVSNVVADSLRMSYECLVLSVKKRRKWRTEGINHGKKQRYKICGCRWSSNQGPCTLTPSFLTTVSPPHCCKMWIYMNHVNRLGFLPKKVRQWKEQSLLPGFEPGSSQSGTMATAPHIPTLAKCFRCCFCWHSLVLGTYTQRSSSALWCTSYCGTGVTFYIRWLHSRVTRP